MINDDRIKQPRRAMVDRRNVMNQTRSGLRAVALIVIAVGVASCSRSTPAWSKDATTGPPADADVVRILAPDAGTRPSFGPLDRVGGRFDRECPSTVASGTATRDGTRRGRLKATGIWTCSYVVTDVLRDATGGAVRHVDLLLFRERHKPEQVRKVTVEYVGDAGLAPEECDRVVDEAAAYVSDLMELGARNHDLLVDLIRRNAGAQDGWFSTEIGGQVIFFQHWKDRPEKSRCGASIDAALLMFGDPVTVVPAHVEVMP